MEDDIDIGTKTKLPKVAKVKNKMPAPVQITAEQLLREAKERELELVQPPPKQKISDEAELKDYRMRKRRAFEDNIRKNRTVITNWLKYAAWEESQQELTRARSVYERVLDIDHRNITIWLKYAEMEMRHRQVNHARNVWDRAVTILPRANQLWYKYTYMEEMLGNVAGCRQVFERWMEWQPEEQAWHSYINFELRYKELDRARVIYERFVIIHPTIKNWLKYAKFEEKNQFISSARRIFERAVEFFGDENLDEILMVAFAKFEESQREHERARVIYKYALDHLPKDKCQEIYRHYTIHEKKFGDRTAIEDVIVSKRKFKYEEDVKKNRFNYDAWFDYLKLMESDAKTDQVREIYERAIANIPPSQEKRHWRRYIYLWINYALYEELEAHDADTARQVYQACLEIIPHKKFTFAKIWLLFAYFEVRQKNLTQTRKILGSAIGKCPKDKLFRGYIELELQLREFDRCRKLYEKFLEFSPENCTTWMKFAEMETILGDMERARAIYELAINQPKLDMPEVLWKAYIDFELEQEEYNRTRSLYERLLQRTKHVKVWLSFAQFELSTQGEDSVTKSRAVYKRANMELKNCEEKEERLMLLEAWKDFEHEYGNDESMTAVVKLMPNKVKRRRKIQTDSGTDAGWEEYFDYIFPDDESAQPNLKLLAMAKMWKRKQENDVNDEEQGEPEATGAGGSRGRNSDDHQEEAADPAFKTELPDDDDLDKDDSVTSASSEESDSDAGGKSGKKKRLKRKATLASGRKQRTLAKRARTHSNTGSDADGTGSDSASEGSRKDRPSSSESGSESSDADEPAVGSSSSKRQVVDPAEIKLESRSSSERSPKSKGDSEDDQQSRTGLAGKQKQSASVSDVVTSPRGERFIKQESSSDEEVQPEPSRHEKTASSIKKPKSRSSSSSSESESSGSSSSESDEPEEKRTTSTKEKPSASSDRSSSSDSSKSRSPSADSKQRRAPRSNVDRAQRRRRESSSSSSSGRSGSPLRRGQSGEKSRKRSASPDSRRFETDQLSQNRSEKQSHVRGRSRSRSRDRQHRSPDRHVVDAADRSRREPDRRPAARSGPGPVSKRGRSPSGSPPASRSSRNEQRSKPWNGRGNSPKQQQQQQRDSRRSRSPETYSGSRKHSDDVKKPRRRSPSPDRRDNRRPDRDNRYRDERTERPRDDRSRRT